MASDPLQPGDVPQANAASAPAPHPQPSEAASVQSGAEIEEATTKPEQASGTLPVPAAEASWAKGAGPIVLFLVFLMISAVLLAWGLQKGFKRLAVLNASMQTSARRAGDGDARNVDAAEQAQAEDLLRRAASSDASSSDEILAEANNWTGKTQRTATTDRYITAAINSRDMHVRTAALEAELALDGVPRDAAGLATLKADVGNQNQRAWALWMLGALANRGVDPVHIAKIIGSYLDDPDPNVRAAAVNGLSLVGTDETVPMLLDRFRNDPSPIVEERAACGLAESGMFTHEQRMVAAASLVGWLDDSLLRPQQRTWAVQALHDISGQSLGSDSAAWQNWYNHNR